MPHLPAKKSLGQHFLTNPQAVEKIVRAAALPPEAVVLEIGPGTGVLTAALLAAGVHVIALEADARAYTLLCKRFAVEISAGALTLHHADVRTTHPTEYIPQNTPYFVVANIPYYLSGMLLRVFLEAERQPQRIVFLVQKEVAERIARSTKGSLLSLSVRAYGTPTYVATVRRGSFSPPPSVDSAILSIDAISRDNFDTKRHEQTFFTLLRAGFQARRKQLFGNLSAIADSETLLNAFTRADIPRTARAEDVPLSSWLVLARALEEHCSSF